MIRRNCLLGVALSGCLAASVAGTALAASTKHKSKTTTTKVTCATKTTIMVANGSSDVLPPVQQGSEFGTVRCGGMGSGVQKDSFTVPDSGDTMASYSLYFPTGTLHGTYDLTPQSNSLNFLAASWTGTMKVLGGTGAYKGDTGTGTMTCNSADEVHTTCTDKLKLKTKS